MFFDWPSFAIGAGVGLAIGAGLTVLLLRDALATYRHRQEYRQAERIAAMLRDILKVRTMPDRDDPSPFRTSNVAEGAYWEAVKEAEQAALKVEMARHMLNYKAGKP